MKAVAHRGAALAVALATLCADAVAGTAVAKIPNSGGMVLQIIDNAISCNGGPTAIVLDRNGEKRDQTCNVRITRDGVKTLFASYGKPVFWSKDQFDVIYDQPINKNIRSMMAHEEKLNDACRGGSGDEKATVKACSQRDAMYAKIRRAGWCWGHADDVGADRRWVQCQPGD